MRKVILAFNFVSILYALFTAIALMIVITGTSIFFPNLDNISLVSLYMIFPLGYNFIVVYGLKQFKTWAYVLAAVEVFALAGYFIINWFLSGVQGYLGAAIWMLIFISLTNLLYRDFKCRPDRITKKDVGLEDYQSQHDEM